MHPWNYSWEGSFAFVITLICTRNLMLGITLIQAKSRNTHKKMIASKENSIKIKHRGWSGNSWGTCSQALCSFPWYIAHPQLLAQQQFYTAPFISPNTTSLQLGPACPSLCTCMCACYSPRDHRSHWWEARSRFRFFGLTLCCWVKAV